MSMSRQKLVLALDTTDLKSAKQTAKMLQPYFGVVKVGISLWSAYGPKAVKSFQRMGFEIFLDLKLHDIPHQVELAASVISRLEVNYVTLHACGGSEMLERAVQNLSDNSHQNGAKALAVTRLTSLKDVSKEAFSKSIQTAVESGCAGIVCSGREIKLAKTIAAELKQPDLLCAVPGIRSSGQETHDQARTITFQEAISEGADLLVVGRAVTQAKDPLLTARELVNTA